MGCLGCFRCLILGALSAKYGNAALKNKNTLRILDLPSKKAVPASRPIGLDATAYRPIGLDANLAFLKGCGEKAAALTALLSQWKAYANATREDRNPLKLPQEAEVHIPLQGPFLMLLGKDWIWSARHS